MRVLFVNHTSQVSGAELAMLDLIKGLRPAVESVVACPPGPFEDLSREHGVQVVASPGTTGSLRLHPVHTTKAIGDLVRMGLHARRLAARLGADVIDAGSIRAGLACALARRLGSPPVVVHVQDVLPPGRAASAAITTLARGTDVLVASSEFTASGLAPFPAHSIPLPVDLSLYDPEAADPAGARRRNGFPQDAALLTVIGQITPWKGQDLGIRALSELVERGTDAMLVIVGSPTFTSAATRFDNLEYERGLHELAARLGVSARVLFLGQREDVADLLAATDALLMLSEGEPFGRVVVEAMAMGVPVVAGDDGGPAETVRDGRDGVLVQGRDPKTWADAIARLLAQPALRARMGASGRERAKEYGIDRYAKAMLSVYGSVLEPPGAPGVSRKRDFGRNRRALR